MIHSLLTPLCRRKNWGLRWVHSFILYLLSAFHWPGNTCLCPLRTLFSYGDCQLNNYKWLISCGKDRSLHEGQVKVPWEHLTEGNDSIWGSLGDFCEEAKLKERPKGLPKRRVLEHPWHHGAPQWKERRSLKEVQIPRSSQSWEGEVGTPKGGSWWN